jgi:hypothetical protein
MAKLVAGQQIDNMIVVIGLKRTTAKAFALENVPVRLHGNLLMQQTDGRTSMMSKRLARCNTSSFQTGKQMKRLSLAVALTLATSGLASAQSFNPTEMSQGLDMLQGQLNNMIASYGIDVNVDELTVAQVAEVISKVNDGADTKQEIERAIELARTR